MKTNDELQSAIRWWYSADFDTLSLVTGLRPFYYNPDEGYQEFTEACDDYWEALSDREKVGIYRKHK